MNIIRGMFGRKKQDDASASKPSLTTKDPATDPNMVRVYDEYGRECYIEKNTWRTGNVLPGALNKARDSPDQLANVVTSALEDGFAADALPYAEILNRTDLSPSRGAAILGATYIALNRFDDAQRVLEAYMGQHGEEAAIVLEPGKGVLGQRQQRAQQGASLARTATGPQSEQRLALVHCSGTGTGWRRCGRSSDSTGCRNSRKLARPLMVGADGPGAQGPRRRGFAL